MDVGSKEVLMESPPVSVIMCVCVHVWVHVCGGPRRLQPVSSSRFMYSIKLELC